MQRGSCCRQIVRLHACRTAPDAADDVTHTAYLDGFEEEALVDRPVDAVLVVVLTTVAAQQLLLRAAVVPVLRF